MAYKNWDLKPRIYKAYQSGTDLIIEGVNLNRWKNNIASIEFFFETHTFDYAVSPQYQGYGYQLLNVNSQASDQFVSTHHSMQTVASPIVTVDVAGVQMVVPLGFDLSNITNVLTDMNGVSKHCRLFANIRWSGLDVATDGASSYGISFNAWREIDTQQLDPTYQIRRSVKQFYAQPFCDFSSYIRLPVATANQKTVIAYKTLNDGTVQRQYLNRSLTSTGGVGAPDGLLFASNATLDATSLMDVRYYEALVQTSATTYTMSLNMAFPVYVLHEEGIESQLSAPMPVVSNMYYDRTDGEYHVFGTGLLGRQLTTFGWTREVAGGTSKLMISPSNPIVTVHSDQHLSIRMHPTIDWNTSYDAYPFRTPWENSYLVVRVGFMATDADTPYLFYHNSIDGVVADTIDTLLDADPTSPNFGQPLVGALSFELEYNSATWATMGKIVFHTNPVEAPWTLFNNLSSGSAVSASYTGSNTNAYRYENVTINGRNFRKVTLLVPVESFPANIRATRYTIARGVGVINVTVSPKAIDRTITFDTPYIVLGDSGYYNVGSEIIRGEKATLLVRAVDLLGVVEHPPTSPYNNTVRISDAEGGWGQQVTVEVVGSDGIEVYPFTVAFLSGGHDGSDFSYEVARFEIKLKSTVNVWKGQLRFSIATPFILNNIRYSGSGYSVPITLTRQDSFMVPLDVEDPASCMRGSIESNVGHRTVNLRGYVPEYLKESPFENFVGVFEETLNTMYTGASTNDPYITKHSILDKIDGLLDLHDPDTIPSKYLHVLASNLGYDMVTGMLRAKDITNAPIDLIRYARFMVASLPEINRNKATKDSIRGLMFSIGALADIYYKWTTDYGTNYDADFRQQGSPETAWSESNENDLYETGTMIETKQITNDEMALTPHFRLDVDLSRLDLYSQTEGIADILARALNTINALRPVNTVLDEMSLVIDVEHDVKQLPTMVQWWGDGTHSITDMPIPPYMLYDSIDEGASTLTEPQPDTIDELSNIITPLTDSVVSPNGLI